MPDPVNAYSGPFVNQALETINEKPIFTLDDIPPALEKPHNGHHVLRFRDRLRPFILNAEKARTNHPHILEKYQIPAEHRLEN